MIPPIPDMDIITNIDMIPAIPGIAPVPGMPAMMSFGFVNGDTIPGINYYHNSGDWQKFSSEFEEKFKDKFSDFYKNNEADFEKMMAEVKDNFEHQISAQQWAAVNDQFNQAQLAMRNFDDAKYSHEEAMKAQQLAMKAQKDAMKNAGHAKDIQQWSKDMEVWEAQNKKHFEQVEKQMKGMEENMRSFEKATKEQLVRDGYLGKDEKITELNWNDDGNITINGKKIKDADKKSYEAIHQKYFKGKAGNFRYVE
jgi:hypothetical protein